MMNLFARSTGGILSDLSDKYFGFPGRIWAQFLCLTMESVFLFAFGNLEIFAESISFMFFSKELSIS